MSLTIHQVFDQCSNLYKAKNSFSIVLVPVILDIHDDLYDASRTDPNYHATYGDVDISGKGVLVYQPDRIVDLPMPHSGGGSKPIKLHLGAQISGSFGGEMEATYHGSGGDLPIQAISVDLYRSFLFGATLAPDLFVHWTGHNKALHVSPKADQAPVVVALPAKDIEGIDGPGTFEIDTQTITLTFGKPYIGLFITKAGPLSDSLHISKNG